MRKPCYLEVVGSAPKPGQEKEYLEWYRGHIDDMFKYGGMKRVSLNKIYQAVGEKGKLSPMYVTVYEFDSKESIAEFYQKVMLPSAGGQLKDDLLPAPVELLFAGYYEPVLTKEK